MKQSLHTLNSHTVLLVEVPEGATDIKISDHLAYSVLDYNNKGSYDACALPPGNWKSLGLCSEIKEDVAKTLVEWYRDSNDSSYDPQYNETTYFDVFKDYMTGDEDELDTAVESLHSFIKAHGYKPETTVLLIKQ